MDDDQSGHLVEYRIWDPGDIGMVVADFSIRALLLSDSASSKFCLFTGRWLGIRTLTWVGLALTSWPYGFPVE